MKQSLRRLGIAALGMTAFFGSALTASGQDFFGTRIFLENSRGGYLSAMNYGGSVILGNSPNRSGWERLELWDINGGQIMHGDIVAMRVPTGHYISDEGGTLYGYQNLTGNRANVAWWPELVREAVPWTYSWEALKVLRADQNSAIPISNGTLIGFLGAHGTYVGVRFDWNSPQYPFWSPALAWAPWFSTWETFRFHEEADRIWNDGVNPPQWTGANCVFYVRARQQAAGYPQIPSPLSTWSQKLRRVVPGLGPAPGRVAIIDTGNGVGHIAIVEQVHPNGMVTIREGNFPSPGIRSRKGYPSTLRIRGYWG